MPVTGSVGTFLLQATSESIGARQAATGGGLLETLAIVAIAIVALLLIALLVVLIPAVRSLRRTSEKMEALLGRLSGDLDPIVGHATRIADNADYISTAVRADIGQLSQTARRANDRLNEALDVSERRVRELAALLRVFQDEVEHAFVSGTSLIRGFRVGADVMREGTGDLFDDLDDLEEDPEDFPDEPGEPLGSGTILDSDADIDDEIEDTLEAGEETDDGYDWPRDGGGRGDGFDERPRIRRRPAR